MQRSLALSSKTLKRKKRKGRLTKAFVMRRVRSAAKQRLTVMLMYS